MNRFGRTYSLAFMLATLIVAATLRLPELSVIPPGLHYDEAANGVLAADIGLRGDRPIFISSYTGKEVLFFYLAGGFMRLVGDSVFALRLTSAFTGLLTIAATYWLGRELLRDRRIAFLAASLLAVSFWHLLFSRLGFRAITQPLLQALTVAALLRGLRKQHWGWLIVAGSFLGLTAYTYLAARLFPVAMLLASLPLLLGRSTYRRRWPQLLVVAFLGLAILMPLLSYFIAHPEAFWVRIGQVAPGAADRLGLGESYLKSLGMFFLEGDPYWRFNLPLRPLFNWFWGGLLVVGWVVLLLRWRRQAADWERSAVLWLLVTPFFMLLPTALATNEIVPSNLRAIGLMPFIFYLPPIGLLALLDDLQKRFGRSLLNLASLVTGVLLLVVGGLLTQRAYFQEWAAEPSLYYETDGDLTAVTQYLDEVDVENKTIFVAAQHYQHPTLAFLSRRYDQVKWLPGGKALVFPPTGMALYVYPANSPLPSWAEPFLTTAVSRDSYPGPDGSPAFTTFELAMPALLEVPHKININFGDAITLLDVEIDEMTEAGELSLTAFWRVHGAPAAEFVPFVHLEDAWGYRWGQVETFAYPTAQWRPGEIIVQRIKAPVPPGTPPGAYRLRLGLFAPGTGERLPRLDEDGRYAGDSFVIENIAIKAVSPPDKLPRPPQLVDEAVGPGLRLWGYEHGPQTAETGETIGLALWWLAGQPQPELTTRLELHPATGPGRILANTQPVQGTYPFSDWQTPIFLIDRLEARIPDDLAAGDYRLHLRVLDTEDETIYESGLGSISIETSQRLFSAPRMRYPLDATFGNEIGLLGYNWELISGGEHSLALAWQADAVPTDDYTVFVHLLNSEGVCCLWQADMMPGQNQYPTSRWLAGEVVVDTYEISLPDGAGPGEYIVEVGLYIAENGRRLQVTIPNLPDSDVVLLSLKIEN